MAASRGRPAQTDPGLREAREMDPSSRRGKDDEHANAVKEAKRTRKGDQRSERRQGWRRNGMKDGKGPVAEIIIVVSPGRTRTGR